MKIPILLLCFIGTVSNAAGQLLAYPSGNQFESGHKFNAAYIAESGIAEIRLTEALKKDGERIRNVGVERVYRFDEMGRTVSVSRINREVGDTLRTFYEYAGGRLECEVHNDASGMFSYCHVYDKEGLPAARKYSRTGLRHRTPPGGSPDLGKITTEEYRHTRYPGQLHTSVLNPSGRPYRKEIRYYEGDLLTRCISGYVMSGGNRDEKYAYDAQNRMVEKTIADGEEKYTLQYAYDDRDRLQEARRVEKEETISRTEYVYHTLTGTLTAELKREETENQIRITTYHYTYR